MRIALCQINPTVGDLEGNRERILRYAERAAEAGAELAVFPELAICGYPPRDLLDRPCFVDDVRASLLRLAAALPPDLAVIVGTVETAARSVGPLLRNAVALIRGGEVEAVGYKRLLPTYDVFDEARYFGAGEEPVMVTVSGHRVGLTICEDIWNTVPSELIHRRYEVDPIEDLVERGAELVVNVAASPFSLPKREGRGEMLAEVARRHASPVVFVNQVGGNDDLIFDGASTVFDASGAVLHRLPSFEEAFSVVDTEVQGEVAEVASSDAAAALDALALGVRDYARKCGFSRTIVGLSGGIDSALTAAIAVRALGGENVLGVAMPTRYSSVHSLKDAEDLARELGITYRVVPIDTIFQGYLDQLEPLMEELAPPKEGDVTFENVQARIRCAVLMAISNRENRLLLTTGNKSELAVGYCTLYGDLAGGLAVIGDLLKTFAYEVAHEVNRQAGREIIPESTLTKAPSAELRPDQQDVDSLPAYDVLDAILEHHVERGMPSEEIVAEGFDRELVQRIVRMVRVAEYKRRQMPPGLIVTRKAFAIGRRFPIANRYRR